MNEMAYADSDTIEFADEDTLPQQQVFLSPWKILVIDDDHGVHEVTRVVLRGFNFEGSGLVLFHAYSGQEGRELIAEHPDAAILLLDVSMETEHAGLDLVKHIREVAKNFTIRIVLRTGQPGSAPEESVIARYDINDYKEKTELTARKMSTLMFVCLRGFHDLMRLENNKRGLMQMHQWRNIWLDIEISIKFSSYHLESQGFVDKLQQQLVNYPNLPQGKLQIEVLETVTLSDITIVQEIIASCRKIGVSFALDDFGTGYSSLVYLSNLPVDVLKIDQSFVLDMLEDKGDMAIVQGIIALAKAFDRQTVAEGIETDQHYQALLDMRCEIGQGYGIARPMPAIDFVGWHGGFR